MKKLFIMVSIMMTTLATRAQSTPSYANDSLKKTDTTAVLGQRGILQTMQKELKGAIFGKIVEVGELSEEDKKLVAEMEAKRQAQKDSTVMAKRRAFLDSIAKNNEKAPAILSTGELHLPGYDSHKKTIEDQDLYKNHKDFIDDYGLLVDGLLSIKEDMTVDEALMRMDNQLNKGISFEGFSEGLNKMSFKISQDEINEIVSKNKAIEEDRLQFLMTTLLEMKNAGTSKVSDIKDVLEEEKNAYYRQYNKPTKVVRTVN